MTELTRERIVEMLETNDKAVGRALLVLLSRQTADEQSSETTRYTNGRGFGAFDAEMGTSMAKFFGRTGYLSPKQLACWRKRDKHGNMRIAKYWRQLIEAAEEKAARNMEIVDAA